MKTIRIIGDQFPEACSLLVVAVKVCGSVCQPMGILVINLQACMKCL